MRSITIRNDDVSFDTNLENLKAFCEGCDRFGVHIIHAITPLGETHRIERFLTDSDIVSLGGKKTLADNKEVMTYLQTRSGRDRFAVHGLWHTHSPSFEDVALSKGLLKTMNLFPDYFVLPFNEGSYPEEFCGLKVLGPMARIEDYLPGMVFYGQDLQDEMLYLHEWRFEPGNKFNYKWEDLWTVLGKATSTQI